jgi:glycosyltransferase involved in cell wall biosynthesis
MLALEPDRRDPEGAVVPPNRILELDDYYVLPERVLPCMLVKSRLLSNLEPPLAGERDLPEALWDVLRRARRCGFRVVVDNRIRIPVENAREGLPPEIRPLSLAEDDGDRALSESALGRNAGLRLETLLSAADRRGAGAAPILLDCTGLSLTFNGTSAAILGLLDGFHRLGPAAGEVGILALAPARSYFRLEERYPRLPGVDPDDASSWGVALRLSQAWRLSTWLDLHRRALAVAAVILDTIGIDILYSAPDGADEAFAFGAEHADGLTYISEFSRDRFRGRFRVNPAVREMVHYLSFDPEDHVTRGATRSRSEPFALIVGNDYEHKDVDRTAMALADAFPFRSFKAIGLSADFADARPNVEAIPSESLSADALQDLYSLASCIVYPSFYEGFGLPIVTGLSLGKTVVARWSPLLREIADRVPPHGRLLGFEHYAELVEVVGSVLHGVPIEGLPLGGGLGPEGRPMSWTAIADRLLKFARECAARGGGEKWRRRDAALRYMQSPR